MRIAPFATLMLAGTLLVGCNKPAEQTTVSPTAGTTPAPTEAAPAPAGVEATNAALTTIAFDKTSHNFGRITEGEKVTYTFKFTNTGTEPLTITDVKPSCGCTASNFSRKPVPPGEQGFVTVEFDSRTRVGNISKTVDVFANTRPAVTTVSFTGEVEAKK